MFPRQRRRSSNVSRRQSTQRRLTLQSVEQRCLMAADVGEVLLDNASAEIQSIAEHVNSNQNAAPAPVLLVISNEDFWYQDYADTRASLEAAGLEVVVAAATTDSATPHSNSGQGADGGFVTPAIALANVQSEDYSAIVFSGGWGMAQYQYGFEGTYHNSSYNGSDDLRQVVNRLIGEFVDQDKHVAAVCYGVSVLAFAEVDGRGLLEGRTVTGWNGIAPGADGVGQTSRSQIERRGANMLASGVVGDASTSTDDVYIDGRIITGENWDSAAHFGHVVATEILAAHQVGEETSDPQPVLMVIANQDFYHREYYETRQSLEAQGLEVVVAAATAETATPHAISVIAGRDPNVDPDLALAAANAADYSGIVFVGGYGAASYQYAFDGVYDNPVYRGDEVTKAVVNDLINAFVQQDKHVTAICNGVTVLAWARVDGESPIAGLQVSSWAANLPSANGGETQVTREHIESNGATQFQSGSIGDPTTVEDDVFIDGNIITAENYDSAYAFGNVVAEQILAKHAASAHDQAISELVG
ncbi:MAG: DJ-1/PfpI family protein [Planctomycetota bacterium]